MVPLRMETTAQVRNASLELFLVISFHMWVDLLLQKPVHVDSFST